MTTFPTPEVDTPAEVADWIAWRCAPEGALEDIEAKVLGTGLSDPFLEGEAWRFFQAGLLSAWRDHDHAVVRGLPFAADGASAILLSLALGRRFRPYRDQKVVKHFQMSPWTTALSHTTQEGHFHTDLNTKDPPPRVTCIQCRTPDPGRPAFGVNRVARLVDLLDELKRQDDEAALRFLTRVPATMVSDTERGGWTGLIVKDGMIRFHPETLRAAWRRIGETPPDAEEILSRIRKAALAVSAPIDLERGDALLVSNHRALHYRGECTVEFIEFPRRFRSREIHVLHLMDEPEQGR